MWRRVSGIILAGGLLFSGLLDGSACAQAQLLGAKRAILFGGVPSWVSRGDGVPAGLDFNFANGRYWQKGVSGRDPSTLLTTSRASVAYEDDLSGNWAPFPPNTLRVTNKGALIEEGRTNSLANSSLTGAVAGTPGTAPTGWAFSTISGDTKSIALPASLNGFPTINIAHSGTTANGATSLNDAFVASTVIAATPGQVWTGSVFWQATLDDPAFFGVTPPRLTVSFRDAGGLNLTATIVTITNRTTLQRVTATGTAPANTAFVLMMIDSNTIANGVSYNFAYSISQPQLELGAFATSPIPTINAAVTRASDVVTVKTLPVFGSTYTLFASGTPNAPASYASNQGMVGVSDGTGNNRSILFRGSAGGSSSLLVQVGGVSQTSPGGAGTMNTGIFYKFSGSFAVNALADSLNGGAVQTAASNTLPPTITTIGIGQTAVGGAQWNGYIPRVALWPTTRLSNAALQSITK